MKVCLQITSIPSVDTVQGFFVQVKSETTYAAKGFPFYGVTLTYADSAHF